MKKLALLLGSLLVVGTAVQAKEIITVVPVVEEVVVEEVILVPVEEANETPWGYVNLRAGWDFTSRYKKFSAESWEEKFTNKTRGFGGEVAVEAYKTLDHFDLGLGIAYQPHMNRKTLTTINAVDGYLDKTKGAEYQSLPLYVTARYDINYWNWAATPYIKGNLGYSFNFKSKDAKVNYSGSYLGTDFSESYSYNTSIKDGMYWAAGVGIEYENFNVDVLYGVNKAKTKLDLGEGETQKIKNDYSRVTLSVGYRFDI